MIISSGTGSLASRGLSALRNMGAWVAIHPDQTYVATSIPGLGMCKSTYCRAVRGQPPHSATSKKTRAALAPLIAVAAASLGILAGCAGYRPAAGLTDLGQTVRHFANCQNYAEPVSPGTSAGAALLADSSVIRATGTGAHGSDIGRNPRCFGADPVVAGKTADGADIQRTIAHGNESGRDRSVLA